MRYQPTHEMHNYGPVIDFLVSIFLFLLRHQKSVKAIEYLVDYLVDPLSILEKYL